MGAVQEIRQSEVEKLLYTKKDAAFALSLSVRTIEYMIKENKLRTCRRRAKVLIPVTEVRRVARLNQL